MGKINGENLWGKLMGKNYGKNLWYFSALQTYLKIFPLAVIKEMGIKECGFSMVLFPIMGMGKNT